MTTARLETFADGVFAIAATLLILDVALPGELDDSLGEELLHIWPQYLAYAISFATIGIIWVNGFTMLAMSATFLSVWLYASARRRLIRPDADPNATSGITRSFLPGLPMYAAATLVAFVSPEASAALFGLLALFYVVSSALLGRVAPSDDHGSR